MIKKKIDKFVDDSKDEMVHEIIKLIAYPSINGRYEENSACLTHFLELAKNKGFKTMTTKEFDVGIVEMGSGEETIGILVHLDVVDVGDMDKWDSNPFDAVVKGGFIQGRGAEDDKGAAIMGLYAMEAIKRLGLPLKKRVWLVVGTSEEGCWSDIEHFKEQFLPPDFGFTPDGRFPIVNMEKGYSDVELTFYDDCSKGIDFLKSGDSKNTIPSRAEIKFCGGDHKVFQGRATHSSTPEFGDNSIVKLCANLCSNKEGNLPDFASFVCRYLDGDGFGKELGIDDGGEFYQGRHVGPTTASPTALWLTDQGVKLVVNIRHKLGTSCKEIKDTFLRLEKDSKYKFEITTCRDPIFLKRDLPFLKAMEQVHDEYGVPGGYRLTAGTTYAKAMKNFVSWGPIMEGDPSTAHMENERLSIETMTLATKMYSSYLYKMSVGG